MKLVARPRSSCRNPGHSYRKFSGTGCAPQGKSRRPTGKGRPDRARASLRRVRLGPSASKTATRSAHELEPLPRALVLALYFHSTRRGAGGRGRSGLRVARCVRRRVARVASWLNGQGNGRGGIPRLLERRAFSAGSAILPAGGTDGREGCARIGTSAGFWLVVSLTGCQATQHATSGPAGSSPNAMLDRTAVGKHRCEAAATDPSPFVVEWDATDLATFEGSAARDVVFVKFHGCELELLTGCSDSGVPGLYGRYDAPTFTSGTVESFTMSNEDELYAKLPLGALAIGSNVKTGETLELEYLVSGVVRSTRDQVYRDALAKNPRCAGATHYVAQCNLGAFKLLAHKNFQAGGEGSVIAIGANAKTQSESSNLKEGGKLASCDTAAQRQCRVPIRLILRPIATAPHRQGRLLRPLWRPARPEPTRRTSFVARHRASSTPGTARAASRTWSARRPSTTASKAGSTVRSSERDARCWPATATAERRSSPNITERATRIARKPTSRFSRRSPRSRRRTVRPRSSARSRTGSRTSPRASRRRERAGTP